MKLFAGVHTKARICFTVACYFVSQRCGGKKNNICQSSSVSNEFSGYWTFN